MDIGSGNGGSLQAALEAGGQDVTGLEINPTHALVSKVLLSSATSEAAQLNILNEDVFDYFTRHPKLQYDRIFSQFTFGERYLQKSSAYRWRSQRMEDVDIPVRSELRVIPLVMDHLSTQGKAVVILPSSVLYGKHGNRLLRELVKKGFLERIIELPDRLLAYSMISLKAIVLSFGNERVDMIDAANIYSQRGRDKYLSREDIRFILSEEFDRHIEVSCEEILAEDRYSPSVYLAPDLKNATNLDQVAQVLKGQTIKKRDLDQWVSEESTDYEFIQPANIENQLI